MKICPPYDRWILMLSLSLIICIPSYSTDYWQIHILGSLFFTFFYWEGNYRIFSYLRIRFSGIQNTVKRIIIQILLSFGYTVVVAFGLSIVFDILFVYLEYGPFFNEYFIDNLIWGLVITLIISTIYESAYFFSEWKKALLEKERIERMEISARYEALKSYVNPHFLFNSLNVLSELVYESAEKADRFIQEFSKIYRYVLEVREKNVVSLHQEVAFIHSYMYLQKIRFENALTYEVKLSDESMEMAIPPLSLQNLVENAIKHNVISEESPLKINIYNKADQLVVQNNLQMRSIRVDGSGFGLHSIKEKYALLGRNGVEVNDLKEYFEVKIPLMEVTSAGKKLFE